MVEGTNLVESANLRSGTRGTFHMDEMERAEKDSAIEVFSFSRNEPHASIINIT